MDELKAIAAALGLPEDSKLEAITAKIATLTAATPPITAEQLAAIATAAGLEADAKPDAVATAVATAVAAAKDGGEPDPAKFVPIEQHQALATQVASLMGDKVAAAVDQAIEDGKLIPAQRDWGIGYATKDLAAFNKFVEAQPAIVKPGRQAPGGKPAGNGELDGEDLAVCAALGIDPDAFKKARADKEEAAL